ncbi:Cap15 family cyclic dinucleotide receptor domain-containing protein [Sphingomonas psychrotolerans]|uniref:Uncharacterized protein n=1 Tax=Sphingomonas psychrotolerans TaxID=1327635 RepID=A0A2K8MHF6_9SPHN|nr:hypothetical protein [Sphingomonas psychrotolerans]ATY30601.1 hypothetical protein CVN68_00135 [Sphingomonas psychrotolerans]
MATEHEYALLGGVNRSNVGKWLMRVSAAVSAAVVFLLLGAVDIANQLGMDAKLPPSVLSLVGAGMVYACLYALFDRYAWRVRAVGKWLKLPDISGRWACEGVSVDRSPSERWRGTVTIIQSWDRIRVHLETDRSSSDSIAAALLHETGTGDRLLYHYRNNPWIGEAELHSHHGFAELIFAPDGRTARGEYFNGRGRNTFGILELVKEN